MDVFRYWIGASPEAPGEQKHDLAFLHDTFLTLDRSAAVEQFGVLGGMILLKVETARELALDFSVPAAVVAFEHRHLAS